MNHNNNGHAASHKGTPQPSPILYADPAPLSEFEKHLQLAGLQNLYRRQCAVICSHMKHEPCYYRPFGDTNGLGKNNNDNNKISRQKECRGLPPAPTKP